jgi:hypothetical protein
MKKLFMFLLVTLYVLPMFSQPTKTDYLLQVNKPSLPCPCDTPKAVVAKKVVVTNKAVVTNKQYHHYKQPAHANTSSLKQPILPIRLYRDSIVINNYINVTNGNNDLLITDRFNKANDMFLTKSKEREDAYVNRMNMILIPQIYRSKGTWKIISGLGLQAFAVGMIAYADIDHYSVNSVTTTQQIPYNYEEYHLTVTPAIVNSSTSKCEPVPPDVPPTNTNNNNNSNNNTSGSNSNSSSNSNSNSSSNSNSNSSSNSSANAPTDVNNTNNNNVTVTTPPVTVNTPVTVTVNVAPPVVNNNINITVPTYTLTSTTKTGYITLTQTHQEVTVRHTNKTPYYIGAGVLGLIGAGLEISGIIDIHHANVYITRNAIGVAIKF